MFLDASVGGCFRGFAEAVANEDGEWRTMIESEMEFPLKLPQIGGEDLGDFATLVAVKAIRFVARNICRHREHTFEPF